MWRSVSMAKLVRQVSHLGPIRAQTVVHIRNQSQTTVPTSDANISSGQPTPTPKMGPNMSRHGKVDFLLNKLNDLDGNKESVYNALDAWVAWEQDFPIGPLRSALNLLEKEQQWHRIIHVIKWILSKGQGTTLGTYGQLIRALDKDGRTEEAHEVWEKTLGLDLQKVPWQQCHEMVEIYYRNNMMEHLVKLFKGLEAFDRNLSCKDTVTKICDAYESLGMIEEKERVLKKYKSSFNETPSSKKPFSRRTFRKKSKG